MLSDLLTVALACWAQKNVTVMRRTLKSKSTPTSTWYGEYSPQFLSAKCVLICAGGSCGRSCVLCSVFLIEPSKVRSAGCAVQARTAPNGWAPSRRAPCLATSMASTPVRFPATPRQ